MLLTLLNWGWPPPPPPEKPAMDGAFLRGGGRRKVRPRELERLREDIIREQRETERYLAELENKSTAPAVTGVPEPASRRPTLALDRIPAPAVPELPDALARAVSAQQVIERARASSAEALARAKAEEKRRVALLLLALD